MASKRDIQQRKDFGKAKPTDKKEEPRKKEKTPRDSTPPGTVKNYRPTSPGQGKPQTNIGHWNQCSAGISKSSDRVSAYVELHWQGFRRIRFIVDD